MQRGEQWLREGLGTALESTHKVQGRLQMMTLELEDKLHLHHAKKAREEPAPAQPENDGVAQLTFGQLVVHTITTAIIILVVAFLYTKYKPEFVLSEHDDKTSLDGDFKHGLFSCFDLPGLALFTFCCGGVRWADTMRMAGFLAFLYGILIWVVFESCSGLLGGLTWLFVSLTGTYYRQKIREAFKMPSGNDVMAKDCLLWCCCGCCAIVQEARQVEEAKLLGHSAAQAELPLSFSTAASAPESTA